MLVRDRWRMAAAVVEGGSILKSVDGSALHGGRVVVYAAMDPTIPSCQVGLGGASSALPLLIVNFSLTVDPKPQIFEL
jgi:hypothetical protein